MDTRSDKNNLGAEFDFLADQYHSQHKENIAISGEEPEYFSEFKVADFAEYFINKEYPKTILDFGSGIGNSIPFFRKYFPNSTLYCADVSARSIEISNSRFPGNQIYLQIGERVPIADQSFDAIFTACVFHHIPHDEHPKWLSELRRILRPNGVMVVYEHNPLNPLTVHAVNTCPIDLNAKLIRAGVMKQYLTQSGWQNASIEYKLFFPGSLRLLRPFEKYLRKFFLGAQWRLIANK